MLQDGIDQQRLSAAAAALSVLGAILLTVALFLLETEDAGPYPPVIATVAGSVSLLSGVGLCWFRLWRGRF